MKRIEKREKIITYCDWCGKELEGSFAIILFPDGSKKHFCSTYTPRIDETCYDKYQEEEFKQATKKAKS